MWTNAIFFAEKIILKHYIYFLFYIRYILSVIIRGKETNIHKTIIGIRQPITYEAVRQY